MEQHPQLSLCTDTSRVPAMSLYFRVLPLLALCEGKVTIPSLFWLCMPHPARELSTSPQLPPLGFGSSTHQPCQGQGTHWAAHKKQLFLPPARHQGVPWAGLTLCLFWALLAVTCPYILFDHMFLYIHLVQADCNARPAGSASSTAELLGFPFSVRTPRLTQSLYVSVQVSAEMEPIL